MGKRRALYASSVKPELRLTLSARPFVPVRRQASALAAVEQGDIGELRRQGRHDEADKALAEFRKRHPDYVISEAMRERVERR